jgi:uncharacterized protein YkwD
MATELELYMLGLVNAERQKVGAPPLKIDEELSNAAHSHSVWMDQNDNLNHTGANGSDPGARITAAGYGIGNAWAENITLNYDPGALDHAVADDMMTGWMNSTGHRTNILNPNLTEIGIGLVKGDYQGNPYAWGTQVFSNPDAAEAAELDKATTATLPTDTPPITPPVTPPVTPPTETPPTAPPTDSTTSEMETYLLSLVNASRAAAGVAALTLSSTLDTAAGNHVISMDERDTADFSGTPNAWENNWFTYGTGVVLDRATIDAIHTSMMNDPGVSETILRPEATQVGLGVHLGDYQGLPAVWVDELFA